MNRKNKIIKNTIAYTIGNFGSKVLSYIMVLVYTHFISSSELGYYDVTLTTISLLTPVVLMMFDDGIYRWLIDDEQKDKKLILSTCLKTVSITTSLSVIVMLLLNLKFHFHYLIGIILFFLTNMFYQMIMNSVRGFENSSLYAASGIINSLVLLISETIGLIVLRLGVDALFFSKVIANIVAIVFIYYKQKELRGIVGYKYDKKMAKNIFNYSAPLIPNNICWWIVNSSDRYIILLFLGTAANGIYSIANKFPTIVSTVTGILYMSLQESFIKEYNSADRDYFYSNIFRKYYILLFALAMCGIPSTKIVIELLTGIEYKSAWMFTGFLFLSTVYSALSSLLGIGYQISRETRRSIFSTVGAAAINIIVNISLIKVIGLHAASFSTLISYVVLLSIRLNHMKKYFNLMINWKEFITINLISLFILSTTFVGSLSVCFIITILAIIFAAFMNRNLLFPVLNGVKSRFGKI